MPSPPSPQTESSRPLILLVEDDPGQLQKMLLELEVLGASVLPARNGAQALDLALTERLDGIVSDINMPLIDGYQLCRILKDDPTTARIPLLLLTGTPRRFSGLWAHTCGADHFLTKTAFSSEIGEFLATLAPGSAPCHPSLPRAVSDLEALQTQMRRTLESKLLESGVRQIIHDLCNHIAHPTQMAWTFLDLLKEIAFPGVVYVAWPGPRGDHIFVLESEGFPESLRPRLDAQLQVPGRTLAKRLDHRAPCPWPQPSDWEGLEFRVPAMDGSEGRWGVFADPVVFRTHGRLLNVIRAEVGLVLQNVLTYHQLLRSNAELRHADLEKSELLQVVTHEIRTPITAVQLYMDLLRERFIDRLPPEEKRGLEATQESIARLLTLINSVLDVERSSCANFQVERQPLDVATLAGGALATLAILGKRHQVELHLDADPTLGASGTFAYGDPHRLVRCFVNLVTNAIKYSPPGGQVRISIQRAEACVRVEIQDQGPGVPESFLQELFIPFHQADTEHGGSGLGLSITRSIVESMGGRVGCRAAEPRGTVFWFELPLSLEEPDRGVG